MVSKNDIFLQIDQTRKGPSADTRGNRDGGQVQRTRFRQHPHCWVRQNPAADKEVPRQEGICAMRSNHLRVYYGPQEESSTVHIADGKIRDSINVPLTEVLPLLADAVRSDRTWLRDFADDEVTISMDLYEVLLAYQHYRRPSA